MQYTFFVTVYTVYNEVYRKIGGAGCITCSPNNFVGGATAPPAPPVPAPICYHIGYNSTRQFHNPCTDKRGWGQLI